MAGFLDRLAAAVAGKAVPVPMPAWVQPSVPDVEEIIAAKERDASSSYAGFIRYTDADGVMTARRIVCRSITGYGRPETVTAWCCERKAMRSFKIERISELVCLETGEVLDPAGHFDQLWMHGALKVADKALNDFGRVLAFMARCDGSVHPLEADSIEHSLERYIVRFGGDDRMLGSALANIGKIAPDGDDLVISLGRLVRHAEARKLARLLLDCVGEVTAADGRYAPSEIEWAEVVTEGLKETAR
ncbi:hypothetical protein [Novosphingobium sp.]|uniref:tellurite resistance TerB family protein n=1 Tax=Novosphingobium sp. TaxID=1874826 RepID=UPI001DBF9C64|nr:hypothetical protein [Novosphingobium sp.]MBX9661908.1 hypothetical protein [Novosphingobium sp.]